MRIYDIYGFEKEVHPVFLYESIANLMIFVILKILQPKRKFEGQIFYGYLVLYAGIRTFLESFRVDSLMFIGMRISQVLSILVCLCVGSILLEKTIKYWIKKFKQEKAENNNKNSRKMSIEK